MGGTSSSAPADYLQYHWDRDVKELFSSVKISDPIGAYDFIIPIEYSNSDSGEKQIHSQIFVSKNGKIGIMVEESLEIAYSEENEDYDVINVFKFGNNSFLMVLNSGIVVLVEYKDEKFEKKEFHVNDPWICLCLDSESFIVANKKGNVYLVNVITAEVKLLWETNVEINDAVLFKRKDSKHIIILVSENKFILGYAEVNSMIVSNDDCPKPKNMKQFNDENIIFSSESNGRTDILIGKINDDLTVDEFKTVLISKDASITMLSKGTALIYNSKEINSFSLVPGFPPKSLRTAFPSNREISNILVIRSEKPRIFIVGCKDGNVFVCKHPTFSKTEQTRKNESIEKYELTKYHREPIKFGCVCDEYSFIYDKENICILWESFPEWFNAPFILNMFDEPFDESYDLV